MPNIQPQLLSFNRSTACVALKPKLHDVSAPLLEVSGQVTGQARWKCNNNKIAIYISRTVRNELIKTAGYTAEEKLMHWVIGRPFAVLADETATASGIEWMSILLCVTYWQIQSRARGFCKGLSWTRFWFIGDSSFGRPRIWRDSSHEWNGVQARLRRFSVSSWRILC